MTRGAVSQESCSPGDRLRGSGWGCTRRGGGVSPRKRGSWGHTAKVSGSAMAGRGAESRRPQLLAVNSRVPVTLSHQLNRPEVLHDRKRLHTVTQGL